MIGSKFAHYEITSHLGTGGMGEVYHATDAKLGRSVAIKLLPEAFARDTERVARFEREARVLASLNHPHIAAIYGLEESGGRKFLVMELVPGETLAERIARGPIPAVDALPIATQIAEALQAAHEKGVMHRDLKPANIKVTPNGQVKVLDFGLAKAFAGEAAVDPSNSPTISAAATNVGVILGTAAYMSPEQAKGQQVDHRTDIFAFGCVLYEMLSGRKSFPGESVSDTLASVLKLDPDWGRLPKDTPAGIRRVLRRCLRKDRNRRLQTIADVRIEIEEAGEESEHTESAAPSTRNRRDVLKWIATGGAVVVAGDVLERIYFPRSSDPPEMEAVEVVTPPTTDSLSFALSPDGRWLVSVGSEDNHTQLWLREIGRPDQRRQLKGTKGAWLPFWKPDSKSVAFFAGGKLRRVDIDDDSENSAQTIAVLDVLISRGGTWGPNGVILLTPSGGSGLYQVPASGGEIVPVTELAEGHANHRYPQFLPGGRQFLFFVRGKASVQGIYLGSLDSPKIIQRVLLTATAGAYLPGWLLFVTEETLLAQRFDPGNNKPPSGEKIRIGGPVGSDAGLNLSAFSVSSTGWVAYRAKVDGGRQLRWFDSAGKPLSMFGSLDEKSMTSVEIYKGRVAVERVSEGTQDVWTLDPFPRRLTNNRSMNSAPVWSPDGRWIVFRSNRESNIDLYVKSAEVDEQESLLLASSALKDPQDWVKNSLLYYTFNKQTNRRGLWVLPMTNDGKRDGEPKVILEKEWDNYNGKFSPDGRFIAYQSNESKSNEIYVYPISGKVGPRPISMQGGIFPRWRHDGKEIYYLRPDDGMLMAVSLIEKGDELVPGETRPIFPPRIVSYYVSARWQYDVDPDTGRFLINVPFDDNSPITYVLNWKPHAR